MIIGGFPPNKLAGHAELIVGQFFAGHFLPLLLLYNNDDKNCKRYKR